MTVNAHAKCQLSNKQVKRAPSMARETNVRRDTPAYDDPIPSISIRKSVDSLVNEIRRPRQLLLHLVSTIDGLGPLSLIWPGLGFLQSIVHSA